MKYSLTLAQGQCFKSILKSSLLGLFFIFSTTLFSQNENTDSEQSSIAIGISSGLSAIIGVDVAANVLPSLGIRAGYNYLKFSKDNYETSLNDLGLGNSNIPFLMDGDIRLNTAQIWFEYMPGEEKLLRIQAGFAYAFDNKIEVNARYGDTFMFNDFPVTPDRVGDMTITYESNKILPYLGLGFGHAVPKKLLSFSLEAGAYYRGEPQITIVGTELFRPNTTNENGAVISSNASKYKIQPVLTLRLGIRLIK